MNRPTKQEQFVALIEGAVFDLVQKYCTERPIPEGSHKDLFDITKPELAEWLKKNYKVHKLPFVRNKPSVDDGFYIIREAASKFRLYYQEYRVHFDECVLNNADEAYSKFAEYLLKGWGLTGD